MITFPILISFNYKIYTNYRINYLKNREEGYKEKIGMRSFVREIHDVYDCSKKIGESKGRE